MHCLTPDDMMRPKVKFQKNPIHSSKLQTWFFIYHMHLQKVMNMSRGMRASPAEQFVPPQTYLLFKLGFIGTLKREQFIPCFGSY
jgi:hypothetical protein